MILTSFVSLLVLALLGVVIKVMVDRSDTPEHRAVMAKPSTKAATIIGWIIIAAAVGIFTFMALFR